ncbi:MAG: hypothetical protein NTW74_14430, partial [Acidobacteria bacterium]|nr:hypothetical protein [Acidobacteriota bacterium]
MTPGRPSTKEINRKLTAAREAIASGKYFFLRPDKVYADLAELELYTDADLQIGLSSAFLEIHSTDYAGSHPPIRAYEAGIKEKELFAFSWNSTHFGVRVYLKFVDLGNTNGPGLCLVSFHKDRPPELKGR